MTQHTTPTAADARLANLPDDLEAMARWVWREYGVVIREADPPLAAVWPAALPPVLTVPRHSDGILAAVFYRPGTSREEIAKEVGRAIIAYC